MCLRIRHVCDGGKMFQLKVRAKQQKLYQMVSERAAECMKRSAKSDRLRSSSEFCTSCGHLYIKLTKLPNKSYTIQVNQTVR